MSPKDKIHIAVQSVIGLALITTTVLTLISMDCFELYIYSLHLFGLNASYMAARIVVVIELVVGVVLTASLLPACRIWRWRPTRCRTVLGVLIVAAAIVVFTVTPPDNLTPAYDSEQNLQAGLFDDLLKEPPLDSLNLLEGSQVVGFFTTGCTACQMAARKLALMQQYYGFPPSHITCVFMGGEENIAHFIDETQTPAYRSVLYEDVVKMVIAIGGQFPTLVFMDEGAVVYTCGYRDMKESEIKAFFTQP